MKVITSPSQVWRGEVVLYDPLTMPQVKEIEAVLNKSYQDESNNGRVWLSVIDADMLPAIITCVKEWKLGNFPELVTIETFPASPRAKSHELIKWLFGEIYKVYLGEIEIPNE